MKKSITLDSRVLFLLIVGMIFSGTTGAIAANVLNAGSVAYNSSNVSTVKDALDTLYDSIDVVTILPTGSIIPYMGTTAPENYLICDGSTYNINDYKKLADHIKDNFGSYNKFGGDGTTTFAVPDLRGEFLRGAGNNSHADQGSGATVGTHQNATKESQIITYTPDGNSYNLHHYVPSTSTGVITGHDTIDSWVLSDTVQNDLAINFTSKTTLTSKHGTYTSRPTNTSVNYLIKAK